MKKKKIHGPKIRAVSPVKDQQLWQLYQNIAEQVEQFDQHPTTAQVMSENFQPAPLHMQGAALVNIRLSPVHICRLDQQRIEQRFFESVQYCCAYYGITRVPLPKSCYPHNIDAVYRHLTVALRKINSCADLFIATGKHAGYLGVSDPLPLPGLIAIDSIADDLQTGHPSALTTMLLHTLTYLIQKVGLAFYWKEHSILYGMYNDIYHDLQSCCEDDYETCEAQIDGCADAGRLMAEFTAQPFNAAHWWSAIRQLQPTTDLEHGLKVTCAELYALYLRYPHGRIDQYLTPDIFDNNEERARYEYVYGLYYEGGEWLSTQVDHYTDMQMEYTGDPLLPARTFIFNKSTPHIPKHLFTESLIVCLSRLSDHLQKYPSCAT